MIFCEFCEILYNTFFADQMQTATSASSSFCGKVLFLFLLSLFLGVFVYFTNIEMTYTSQGNHMKLIYNNMLILLPNLEALWYIVHSGLM